MKIPIPSLDIFQRAALKFKNRISVMNYHSNSYTYEDLLGGSLKISNDLTRNLGKKEDLNQDRIAFFLPPSFNYVQTKWGIWRAGGVATPLSIQHPPQELEYILKDSQSSMVVTDSDHKDFISEITKKLNIPLLEIPTVSENLGHWNEKDLSTFYMDPSRNAMIIYTSGTTSRPKGVVTTHLNIEAQITTLVNAWKWTENDHILQVLPLHHVHGVINCVQCAMYSGATCEMMPSKFSPELVINRLIESHLLPSVSLENLNGNPKITLFMAVPTIYAKLIKYILEQSKERQDLIKLAFQDLRLMVSGSSALPETVKKQWEELTGHVLLERYGMTEIGMALSNPLEPVSQRLSGSVGFQLPGVHLHIQEANSELLVKGPQVFKEYFNKPKETKEAFTVDGWFRTGDIAERDPTTGHFKILGRSSVDIIKFSGYKISALEIEREILEHPDIDECSVIGVPDPIAGEIIYAILVLKKGKNQPIDQNLNNFLKDKLAHYKIPKKYIFTDEIPKNAMSKINKKELLANLDKLISKQSTT
ncbi:hypothetical protein DLAC_11825 [Tieghemostelium lacteum]|uniref:Uncharacterized protein n=1 Tax=Tieghemostelium lacteum TaxID=361077 RepID=A0A151Z411_TIELA|nr:hypothetical protein DLAC_11825 [Tieghemostelium lacteum]|eukprot:KYQ88702.1 hypothetical protein DLAC_11825 [Tieghemostelium lacteum]